MLSTKRVFGVMLAAIALRLGTAIYLGDSATPISGAYDQISYDTLAVRWLDGYGLSFPHDWYPFIKVNVPTAHWSFAYTFFLAGIYAVAGHHPLVARVAQALMSGAFVWLLFRLGKQLFNERVGIMAGAAFAAYAYWIFFNAALMTQTFYVMCLLAALLAALDLRNGPTWKGWLTLGLALGLGALFRQTLLLFAPVLLVWLIVTLRGTTNSRLISRKTLAGLALTLALVAACVLPWTARNYAIYGDFLLLNSNGGYWLYASNHPSHGTNFDASAAPAIPLELQGLSEPAEDRALFRTGIAEILADPSRFIALSLNRTKDYFWLVPSDESSPISNIARMASFALYLPFMLAGLWLSRAQWRACMPLYLYVAFDTMLHLMTWAAPRYRLPSDAVMLVFAGVAVVYLVERAGHELKTARSV